VGESEERLIDCLISGISRCILNPDDHRAITRHVGEAHKVIESLMTDQSVIIVMRGAGDLLVNGVKIQPDRPQTKNFSLKLKRKGVAKVIFCKGVKPVEVQTFLTDMASSGRVAFSSHNVAVAQSKRPAGDFPQAVTRVREDLLQVRRIYRDISSGRSITIPVVNAIMERYIARLHRGVCVQDMLLPVEADSDGLFAHSANVAMLSLFQAELLGVGNAILHDIGLSALLHDVGKTLLPKSVQESQYSLDNASWELLKKHSEYGAALLSSMDKVPEIAIIVAYEHHMKYDGTGFPETRRMAKKQHIISQIIAIADFYAALAANLPHRKQLSGTAIVGLLVDSAGTAFNPLLVRNFVQALGDRSRRIPNSQQTRKECQSQGNRDLFL